MAYREDYGTLARAQRRDNGSLIVDATFTRSGVFLYYNADGSERWEYRPEEEVFKPESVRSLAMVPFTDLHPPTMVTASNAKQYAVGQVGENIRRDGTHLAGRIAVNVADVIAKMDAGENELSCGYECDLEMKPGITPDGKRYDAIQRNIMYNHVARVPAGRAETARARMDALVKRVSRADAAMQVPTHAVSATECDPEGVTAWVSSSDMTSAELVAKVQTALAAWPHISVNAGEVGQLVRVDEKVHRVDGSVRIGTSYAVSVRVASKTMTADQLNATLSAALSASPDFITRTDSKTQEIKMDLTQALAALAEANKQIGTLTAQVGAEKTRADAADAKVKTAEQALAVAEQTAATEKTRADKAESDKTAAEKARTDAAQNFDARVEARGKLVAVASTVLGKEFKADGKTDRDLKVAVVAKLDGVTIPAERSDDAVDFAYKLATDRADAAGKALGAARETLVAHNIGAGRADTAAPAGDREEQARKTMQSNAMNAWKFDHKKGGSLTADDKE